ncbi:hypothetical protein I8748_08895 [Nostoc sp. CENA67]|uniref:Uncharacterized protein n=1 Tax=Amazonocrinis nigriterrae CENA67 TaxID=2794033 RepID=A0A8J7HRR4_9NOST|nr:hypothetical protein [Amazonocrinis nigriterrae]MBH8562292.1 hypothetical protein [Amazonocrinis nigriterrae CENA67]
MIPTKYKNKLSRLMSYPISAGILSKALLETPQLDQLSIAFYDSCQEPHKIKNPAKVLSVTYSHQLVSLTSSNKAIEYGWYEPKWSITVYPVPRTCVSLVKSQLVETGLDKMKQWLHKYKDAMGKVGGCGLHFFYDLETNLLSFSEDENLSA